MDGVLMTKVLMPRFPVGDPQQRERFFHHIEFMPGWEYRTTSIHERDLPGEFDPHSEARPRGWDFRTTQPDGFHLNLDRGVGYDEAQAGWTKVAPGVLRNPNGGGGPMLIAYWRRKK